jgi:hypothetical protein
MARWLVGFTEQPSKGRESRGRTGHDSSAGPAKISAMRSVSPATRVECKSISEARNHARSAGHSRLGDCQALAHAATSYVVNTSLSCRNRG